MNMEITREIIGNETKNIVRCAHNWNDGILE
jgi:hypothetical protein